MKKYAIFNHLGSGIYRLNEHSDISMSSMFTFLRDGLPSDFYVNFLNDKTRKEFYGNVSELIKHGDKVTVNIDQNIYTDAPSFTMTIDNILFLLSEWKRLTKAEVDRIEIDIDDNNVAIKGDWVH